MTLPPATVRSYKPDDFAAVVRLLGDLSPWKRLGYTASDWERLFETPLQGREVFVIETGGSVVGVGVLRQRFLFGDYLELFAIAASAQGRGYGRALLAHLESVVFRRAKNRSEEHTSELQSQSNLVCRLLLEKKKKKKTCTHNELPVEDRRPRL